MTLRIEPVADETREVWRAIHNEIIPTDPLSAADVAERAVRNRLTLAYADGVLIGNATLRPPTAESATATVIVRILPEFRRRGYGSACLASMLDAARATGAARIETVVLASNEDGLAFASAHGFVEFDRYALAADAIPFVDLYLAT